MLCKTNHQDLSDLWMLQHFKSLCPKSRIRDGRKQELTLSSHQDPALCPDCVHLSCHSPHSHPHPCSLALCIAFIPISTLCMIFPLSLMPCIFVLLASSCQSNVIPNIFQMNSAFSTSSLFHFFFLCGMYCFSKSTLINCLPNCYRAQLP